MGPQNGTYIRTCQSVTSAHLKYKKGLLVADWLKYENLNFVSFILCQLTQSKFDANLNGY